MPAPIDHLPLLVRLAIAAIIGRQNQMLIAELAFVRTELRFVRSQLPAGKPLHFTDEWRKRLARAGSRLGLERLMEIASVAKADTIRGWYRRMVRGTLEKSGRKVGKSQVAEEVQATVRRLAEENHTWGQHGIAGEMAKLGMGIAPRTVAAILKRHGLTPAPERGTDSTWKQFLTEHMECTAATDFFTVDTWGWLGKSTWDVLFVIDLGTRNVHLVGITQHAVSDFMVQTARNLTMTDMGWLTQVGARYLIHDRDTKFCAAWQGALARGGVETVAIPPRSPNLNAFAERWVRTVKHECIRHCWFIGRG